MRCPRLVRQTVKPAYGFDDDNKFMDSKNPFEEGMKLFKAGPSGRPTQRLHS